MENQNNPLEFFLFRNYSKAVKGWIKENVYLRNYPDNDNVAVDFATPEKAWAKYCFPVLNGQPLKPNITFKLEDPEYKEGENLLGYVTETRLNERGLFDKRKPPLVYELNYSCTIYTNFLAEADVLRYQLTVAAHKNKKACFMVDGQWCELKVDGWNDNTAYEPGEVQDRLTRVGFKITIPRAYLPMDYLEDAYGKIESINVGVETPDGDNEKI